MGELQPFGCGMYVELIRCFHSHSIMDDNPTGAGEKSGERGVHSPGYVAFSQKPEVLKTQPEEGDVRCKKHLMQQRACFYMNFA